MTDNPIHVEFTIFNQIELLRQEVEKREEELRSVESSIRDILFELEKIRYLQSLDAFYHNQKNVAYPANYESFPDLEQRRTDLVRVIATLKQTLEIVSQQTSGARPVKPSGAPDSGTKSPSAPPGGAKRGFDDFDTFRQRRRPQ
ncbi:MAG: hypothetical protein ABIH86_02070 [Planctomycetota bacterium]